MRIDLSGKNAIVTGAGTGIGRGIALQLGQYGANVFLHYAHSAELNGVVTTYQKLRDGGLNSGYFLSDFSQTGAAAHTVAKAIAALGDLDIVVNNAGVTFNQRLPGMSEEQFDFLFRVNVRAQLFIAKAALPSMIKIGSGCIINLSSVHAYQAMIGYIAYSATKGAIVAMTRAQALELSKHNIRVNSIAPGWIETENQHKVMQFDANFEGQKIPARRLGQPSDVAKLASFLASDAAEYINGQTIIIDGGLTCPIQVNDGWQAGIDAPFGHPYITGI